jgi:hypothetical protein
MPISHRFALENCPELEGDAAYLDENDAADLLAIE